MDKRNEDKPKLKSYEVRLSWTSVKYFKVKAASAEEAERRAEEREGEPDDYWESPETTESEEIKGG